MVKSARAFQMPEEDREAAPLPSPPLPAEAPVAQPSSLTPTSVTATLGRPSYREGRRNLSVWLEAKAFNSFKAMVAQEGSTISDYMVEMINREFARKGLPQIARK